MKIKIIYTLTILAPFIASAQTADLNGVADGIRRVFNYLFPIIIGFAVVLFLWGILNYVLHGDDENQRKESKQFMLWGVVGLFVMVSVWGLVFILAHTFGVNVYSVTPKLPTLGR